MHHHVLSPTKVCPSMYEPRDAHLTFIWPAAGATLFFDTSPTCFGGQPFLAFTASLPPHLTPHWSFMASTSNATPAALAPSNRRLQCSYGKSMGHTRINVIPWMDSLINYGLSPHSSAIRSWILDSDASNHIASNPSLFWNLSQPKTLHHVTLAYGSKVKTTGIGQATPLPLLPLNSVLFIPGSPFNLVSVSQLTHTLNCSITFINNFFSIHDRSTG